MRYQNFQLLFIGIVIGVLSVPLLNQLGLLSNQAKLYLFSENVQVQPTFNKTRLGVLIMATGNYARFSNQLVRSARLKLLSANDWQKLAYKVTYYIFTDNAKQAASGDDVTIIHQRRMGWPSDTLWRCSVYVNATKLLEKETDYLFSLDADMMILKPVGPEILGDLVGTVHPGYYNKSRMDYDYERNARSAAYIPPTAGLAYFAGGVFGGRTRRVLDMCETMNKAIVKDFYKDSKHPGNFTARWHDESHLNRYFAVVKPPTVMLSPAYCFPQIVGYGEVLPYEAKIMALHKPHEAMRNDPKKKSK